MVEDNRYWYIIEYYWRDKRGSLRTKREMRGTFELILDVWEKLAKMVKENDPKAPVYKPRFIKVGPKGENIMDFKEEYENWKARNK